MKNMKRNVLAKIKGMVDYKRYLQTLLISTVLAVLTLLIAFGMVFFALDGDAIPGSFILLTFAVFFIISTVFYESRIKFRSKSKSKSKNESMTKYEDSVKSLIRGLFLGICTTFAFVTVIGSLQLAADYGPGLFDLIGGFDSFISALAICMIVIMVILSLLRTSYS